MEKVFMLSLKKVTYLLMPCPAILVSAETEMFDFRYGCFSLPMETYTITGHC